MGDLPRISEAEWAVMDVIWQDHPITAQDVVSRLARRTEWTATTVKTLLARLVAKGVLAFERDGRRFLYQPRITRSQAVACESRSFVERVFRGKASPLLSFFLKNSRLSAGEIAELRKLLKEKEGSR